VLEIRSAEQCLHDRGRLAFAAAAGAGLGGGFSAFAHRGLLVLRTTAPGLGALNLVCGVTEETVGALPGVSGLFAARPGQAGRWRGGYRRAGVPG
jgi:hypothetical protein